jgi:hypothetical protein
MLRFDIIGPAFAISVFLLIYYIAVGFFIVYFATVFGYSEQRANALGNWYWASNAIALVVAGALSDKVRVRKPFMLIGTAISLVGTALFAVAATKPDTSYYTFAVYFILIAVGTGTAYCNWMAAYTETVEKHNPAATATGLAIWGWIIRAVITVALIVFTFAVPATSKLVDQGPTVQALATKYASQLQTAAAVDPATLAALSANPNDAAAGARAVGQVSRNLNVPPGQALSRLVALGQVPKADLAYLQANGAKVQQAQKDNPKQWQKWWWVTFAGQIVFLPFVFLLTGRWSPKRARRDELEHEQLVERELAKLQGGHVPVPGEPAAGAGQA